jgi:methylenetetrahydrofolate reductase (NADPH)
MSASIARRGASEALSASESFVELVQDASLEVGVHDVGGLASARSLLAPKTRVFVSHLPKQSWDDTISAARAVQRAGFRPVPHIPVQLLGNAAAAGELLAALRAEAEIDEALIIAGDYPQPRGDFACVLDFLRTDLLQKHGLTRVCFAGHPEGHPQVPLDVIRRAEIEKVRYANQVGLQATLVTQFFFQSQPFVEWAASIRAQESPVRIAAGLAGPTSIPSLLKFAARCGVGRSIRALSARTGLLKSMLGDFGPEALVFELARSRADDHARFDGIHLFSFGGFLRTCEWLHSARHGEFSEDR